MDFIDHETYQTRHAFVIKSVFVFGVLVLAYGVLSWWQILCLLAVVGVGWYFERTDLVLTQLSAKEADDIWQLGMVCDGDDELWQGYLTKVRAVDFGVARAVQLSFDVVLPMERPYQVWIWQGGIDEMAFRRLLTLAKFGGQNRHIVG